MPWSPALDVGGHLQSLAFDVDRLKLTLTPHTGEVADVRVRISPATSRVRLEFLVRRALHAQRDRRHRAGAQALGSETGEY